MEKNSYSKVTHKNNRQRKAPSDSESLRGFYQPESIMQKAQEGSKSLPASNAARHILSPFNNVAQNLNLNPLSSDAQRLKVLAALVRGDRLTAISALSVFGCARLAARIQELRADGWPIISERIEVVNRDGKAVRVAEYYLDQDSAA